MKHLYKYTLLFIACLLFNACGEDYLALEPRGFEEEKDFYQTQEELFQALVAAYDVLQWGGTNGWTMKVGLLNAASDDCFAGGSNASDQPSWVAYDDFSLDPFLGPQSGIWNKCYSGIYRANLFLTKIEELEDVTPEFKSRTIAEAKFLRAYFYFDLVRFFGDVPLITEILGADDIYSQTRTEKATVYAQIEQDLNDARSNFVLPPTVPDSELGRITQGAADALLGKVILYQNNEGRMQEAVTIFDEVINSGSYTLESNFGNIFDPDNEFGTESIFEIVHSPNQSGGWGNFTNGTEGNYNTQFFGMREYVGPTYATGWSFCPVTEKLATEMQNDPRYQHTIIDGNALKAQGAVYTDGYQNTNFFIRKYAGLQENEAPDGEVALNWGNNEIEIRLADVILMAAEASARSGNEAKALTLLNQVRGRVNLVPYPAFTGDALLNAIYKERQLELATEGHRFFDLVRTGRAAAELGDQGFVAGKHEVLPIAQSEIDLTEGAIVQNPGY